MRRRCLRPRSCLNGMLAVAMAAGMTAVVLPEAAVAVPAVPGAVPAATAPVPSGTVLYSSAFNDGSVTPDTWITGAGPDSEPPCLTAGEHGMKSSIDGCDWRHPDPAGQGVLRLTGNARLQSGFAFYTQPLDATQGLDISFNMYQYDTTTRRGGADGIGFVLINGTDSPTSAGEPGGWLGYRGIDGAYLGVGFDEWGNFSNRALWGSGPDRLVPDSIVLRGARAADYPYIVGVRTPRLAIDDDHSRDRAVRHVNIRISTSGDLTVSVDFGHDRTREITNVNLDNVPGQPSLPPTVKFGFTAATGDDTAIHEVSDLVIRALRPDLRTQITAASTFQASKTGSLVATVSADRTGGPTSGTVTALISVPGPLTPQAAQGDGWTCAIAGQEVSCARADVLLPGDSYPPIDLTTAIAHDAPPEVTVRSSASTPDMFLSPGNASQDTVPVEAAPPPPDLSVTLKPTSPLVAGGTGQLRMDVSNAPAPGAGPTTGPVTLTYHVPAESTVLTATGDGWTCAITTPLVTCQRPDVLNPGDKFPPVFMSTAICHKADCALTGATATATTPGTGPATAGPLDFPVSQHSALGLSLSSNPAIPEPGYDTTFTAVITNAGPTDVENADITVHVPPGFNGQWTCQAASGSGCPGTLSKGALATEVYVASGGTVTLTATGQADGAAAASNPVSATLFPPATYTDLYCSDQTPCVATGDATAGDAAK